MTRSSRSFDYKQFITDRFSKVTDETKFDERKEFESITSLGGFDKIYKKAIDLLDKKEFNRALKLLTPIHLHFYTKVESPKKSSEEELDNLLKCILSIAHIYFELGLFHKISDWVNSPMVLKLSNNLTSIKHKQLRALLNRFILKIAFTGDEVTIADFLEGPVYRKRALNRITKYILSLPQYFEGITLEILLKEAMIWLTNKFHETRTENFISFLLPENQGSKKIKIASAMEEQKQEQLTYQQKITQNEKEIAPWMIDDPFYKTALKQLNKLYERTQLLQKEFESQIADTKRYSFLSKSKSEYKAIETELDEIDSTIKRVTDDPHFKTTLDKLVESSQMIRESLETNRKSIESLQDLLNASKEEVDKLEIKISTYFKEIEDSFKTYKQRHAQAKKCLSDSKTQTHARKLELFDRIRFKESKENLSTITKKMKDLETMITQVAGIQTYNSELPQTAETHKENFNTLSKQIDTLSADFQEIESQVKEQIEKKPTKNKNIKAKISKGQDEELERLCQNSKMSKSSFKNNKSLLDALLKKPDDFKAEQVVKLITAIVNLKVKHNDLSKNNLLSPFNSLLITHIPNLNFEQFSKILNCLSQIGFNHKKLDIHLRKVILSHLGSFSNPKECDETLQLLKESNLIDSQTYQEHADKLAISPLIPEENRLVLDIPSQETPILEKPPEITSKPKKKKKNRNKKNKTPDAKFTEIYDQGALPVYSINLEFYLDEKIYDWIAKNLPTANIEVNKRLLAHPREPAHITILNLHSSPYFISKENNLMQDFLFEVRKIMGKYILSHLTIDKLTGFNFEKGFIAIEFKQDTQLEKIYNELLKLAQKKYELKFKIRFPTLKIHTTIGKAPQDAPFTKETLEELNKSFLETIHNKTVMYDQLVLSCRLGNHHAAPIVRLFSLNWNSTTRQFVSPSAVVGTLISVTDTVNVLWHATNLKQQPQPTSPSSSVVKSSTFFT